MRKGFISGPILILSLLVVGVISTLLAAKLPMNQTVGTLPPAPAPSPIAPQPPAPPSGVAPAPVTPRTITPPPVPNPSTRPSPQPPAPPAPPASGAITITGKMVCLPKKGPGPHTMECAFGIESGGKYYGLRNMDKIDPQHKFSTTEIIVKVTGTYQQDSGSSQYDIEGSIFVSSITEIPPPSPAPSSSGTRDVELAKGERRGSLLVEEIYADRVTGLNFMEYPVARDEGFPVTLLIGDSASNGCTISLTLIRINTYPSTRTATFREVVDNERVCPICLSSGTLIDTPVGQKPIETLKKGDLVWTHLNGSRIAVPIIKTGSAFSRDHKVAHIRLADRRELKVSPGHPDADGQTIGELRIGDLLDGSMVESIELIDYSGTTYDILPLGGGAYWANEILLRSTIN